MQCCPFRTSVSRSTRFRRAKTRPANHHARSTPAFSSFPVATLPLTLPTCPCQAAIVPSDCSSKPLEPFLYISPSKCPSSAKLPSLASHRASRWLRPADGACPMAPRTFLAEPESASETAAQTTTWYMVRSLNLLRDIQ